MGCWFWCGSALWRASPNKFTHPLFKNHSMVVIMVGWFGSNLWGGGANPNTSTFHQQLPAIAARGSGCPRPRQEAMGKKTLGVPGKRSLPSDYRHPFPQQGGNRVPQWAYQAPPPPDFWHQQQQLSLYPEMVRC